MAGDSNLRGNVHYKIWREGFRDWRWKISIAGLEAATGQQTSFHRANFALHQHADLLSTLVETGLNFVKMVKLVDELQNVNDS